MKQGPKAGSDPVLDPPLRINNATYQMQGTGASMAGLHWHL
jgi:hypothetical protein